MQHHKGPVGGKKPKNTKKTLLRIFSYMLRYKLLLFLVLILIIISSVAGVAGTYLLKPIINQGIVPLIGKNPATSDYSVLIRLLTITGIIYFFGAISSYLYSRIMVTISNKTLYQIREDMFNNMQDLPIRYFDTNTHGDLMSKYTNDVDTLRDALSNGVTSLLTSFITVVGTFIVMLLLSPILTILVIVMVYVMIKAVKVIGQKSADNFRTQQKSVGNINGYIEELISGQKVVKVFTYEDETIETFIGKNEELRVAATKANIYGSVIMPLVGNISYFNYAITAIVGALMTIKGYMDLGSIASFLQYSRSFSNPITQVSQQLSVIFAAIAGAERIFEAIDEKVEYGDETISYEDNGTNAYWLLANGKKVEIDGDVEFEYVKFGYNKDKVIIHDLNIIASPGQKIALVGSTGAGKTTITNLLNRFYDIQGGKILIDGVNIKDIKKDDLRKSLAMVLQDTHLFTGTVMENIRYGRLNASDEEVIDAAKLANAHSFIKHLPKGYDTVLVSDGSNLSQGQRQLLNIARAAVANPQILILDEATSSIDTRTEKLIEKGMNKLMTGRTVFMIAHRLSTVRSCDKIIVLEYGKIIEQGNHEELLAKKGKYYQLYTGQIELD